MTFLLFLDFVSKSILSSKSVLCQQFDIYNAAVQGLRLGVSSVIGSAGFKCVRLSSCFRDKNVNAAVHVGLLGEPTVCGDLVLRYKDLLIGGNCTLNCTKAGIEDYCFGVAVDRSDCKIGLKARGLFDSLTASYLQAISSYATIVYRASYCLKAEKKASAAAGPLTMDVGIKYWMNPTTFMKAKIDQQGGVSMALSSVVSPGLRLVLGGIFDARKAKEAGSHKLGVNVVFEA